MYTLNLTIYQLLMCGAACQVKDVGKELPSVVDKEAEDDDDDEDSMLGRMTQIQYKKQK